MKFQALATATTALSLMGLIVGTGGNAEAVKISRVTDINPSGQGFDPRSLTVFNNAIYFSGNDGLNGYELWKYDGSTTSLVADINPGVRSDSPGRTIPNSSSPGNLTGFDNALYFRASDGDHGSELWKYDGINASLVADINPGSASSFPVTSFSASFPVFNNAIYFRANDGIHGSEPWAYDGTTTSFLADINPGSASSGVGGGILFNNAVYSGGTDGVHGGELWEYDGTAYRLAADINPGSAGSGVGWFALFDNDLYFRARDGEHGDELWKYDGTNASLVADIDPGNGDFVKGALTAFNNVLYFAADDRVHGWELWQYDGITGSLVADINPGEEWGVYETFLTVFNDTLYFKADDGVHGYELWQYDGNTVSLVADLNPGRESSVSGDIDFVTFNDALYFQANDGVNGLQIWKLEPDQTTAVPEPTSIVGLLAFGVFGAGSILKSWRR